MTTETEHREAAGRFRTIVRDDPTAMQRAHKVSSTLNTEVLEVDEDGRVRMAFNPDERFINAFGSIHGGIVAAMVDEACTYAATSVVGAYCFLGTVELSTRILSPSKPGRIEAVARTLKVSRRAVFADAEIFYDSQRVATGTALILIDFSQPVRRSWVN